MPLKERTTLMQPVSILTADKHIIQTKLSNYGDFSRFVRFCLRDEEQIKKFRMEKASLKRF